MTALASAALLLLGLAGLARVEEDGPWATVFAVITVSAAFIFPMCVAALGD